MLKINNLSFGYAQKTSLLNGLTLNLEPGHVYGLLGQNGAGKTTLLKIMAGLCFPSSGTCSVLGQVPAERRPEFLAQLFFMPESFNLPPMTVAAYQKYYGAFYPHFDQDLFEHALEAFGLGMRLNLAHFSHGQKKMFMMSFALATRVALLILDEPTNGLDIPNKQIWQSLFAKEIREDQLVIVSTHQVHDVENLIDSVLIMKSGKIIMNAPLHEVETKLHFGFTTKMPAANSVLYTEQRPGGYVTLTQNEQQEDSAVDLTLLFNAAISNTQVAKLLIEERKYV